jgi:DNA (cytosine-5)-methyltransferase 1
MAATNTIRCPLYLRTMSTKPCFNSRKDEGPIKRSVLDLYSGLGGLSLGFEFTGAFRTIGGIDNYPPAVATFSFNHTFTTGLLSKPADMSVLQPLAVVDELGETPDVIVGGPPCQGFSHAGRRLEDLKEDSRNDQVFHFFRFVRDLRPKVFLMENVSGILRTGQAKKNELIDNLAAEYRALGYSVAWKVLNTAHYRVPQVRKRFIMVGIRDSATEFSFPSSPCTEEPSLFSEPMRTVLEALGDMPDPSAGFVKYDRPATNALQRFLREDSDGIWNHLDTRHSEEMIERLKAQQVGTRLYPNWNHSWYRLDPSRPSPAVKENHRAPFVHFSEPRAASPRECARLQSIPDRYRLVGTKTAQLIMVGNAVPPIFSAHLATAIAEQAFSVAAPRPWTAASSPLGTDTGSTLVAAASRNRPSEGAATQAQGSPVPAAA